MIYNVSWMATKKDNGVCASFRNREKAEQCRQSLIEWGCYYVSEVWG